MMDKDDVLQQQLIALEKGAQLGKVLDELPEQDRDLAPLISLAAAVREIPHPDLLPEHSQAQQQKISAAASGMSDNHRNPNPISQKRSSWPKWSWALVPAVALAGVVMLCFVASLLGVGLWLAGPSNARAATLMDAHGQIEVAFSANSNDWRSVTNGEHLRAGQRLRTHTASGATLLFFDGSRTMVGSDADITLTKLNGGWGNALTVTLTQNAGLTSHSVVPLRGKNSAFLVFTPSGSASVHGTTFSVDVTSDGKSRFAVNTGTVLVRNADAQVSLTAGQATAAQSGQKPAAPAFQFALVGLLTSKQADTWVVAGVSFNVNADTEITGDPQERSMVRVEGRVLEDGSWVADDIEPAEDNQQTSSFTGTVQAVGSDAWQVGDKTVLVNSETELGKDLSVGSPVRVTFTTMPDGSWLAIRIESLEVAPPEPTSTPAPTPDPNAKPSLSFKPEEMEISSCGTDFNLNGALVNEAEQAKDVAANVQLGYQIVKGAAFVNQVELNPVSWDVIAAGQTVNFAVHVTLNPSWSTHSGQPVQLRVFVLNETNRPDHLHSRLTVTITSDCNETETPEGTETPEASNTPGPSATATETATETMTATPGPSPTPGPSFTPSATTTAVTDCTGANPQPKGLQLSREFGVSYEEIMGWFCQGFGFGEIDHAYSLSRETGVPVASIFDMRRSGLGWGEIRKQLTQITPKPTKDNPHKK